tara:strand:+ start:3924 stop:4253 length:330 start_codon:yes stop_codon:yes gene_type:complete
MHKINTNRINTDILALLALSALVRFVDSPIYLASFSILNTLNKRNARKATNEWDPININDKYFGMVDNKSMIPKKLKMYLSGFFTVITLAIYSNEKSMVITHSAVSRKE